METNFSRNIEGAVTQQTLKGRWTGRNPQVRNLLVSTNLNRG